MPASPTGGDACATCFHCGTPFRPTAHRPDFCCTGCQFVHDLIARNGFGQFYDLQEGGVPPVQSLVFQKREYAWLDELARDSAGTLTLDVQGLSCIGCAWLIEKLFSRQPGALAIHVDPTLGRLSLRWQPGVFEVVAFARELQSFGYLVGPPGKSAAPASRALNLRLGLCAALALNTMLFTLPRYLGMSSDFEFAPLFHRLTLILGTLSFLIGGSYFFIRTWRSVRQGVLHIDLPISLGLVAAYAGSVFAWIRGAHGFVYFDFVATFTFLMLAGRWLQQKAVERNRHQLLATQAELPPVRLASGEKVPLARIATSDVFSVEPGQVVPVLARLCSEGATLGMEWISGESEAASARRGRLVPAGAMNCGQSAIELEARESWADSLLAKLLRITPTGTTRDAAFERFLRGYIGVVLGLAAAGFCGWWVATGALLPALQVLISVLVVSCPCASGVALPLCRDLATSRMRGLGVFIRDGELWAKLDRVRKILFDKTGTLTLETISLRNPEALRHLTADERAMLLAMVHDNLHPVSGCLREQLLADGVQFAPARVVSEVIGFGLEMEHAGSVWRVGRPEWPAVPEGRKKLAGGEARNERNHRNKIKTDRTPAGVQESSAAPAGADRFDAPVRGLTPPANFRCPSGTESELGSQDRGPDSTGAHSGDCIFTRDGETLASFRFGEEARDDAREELATLRARGCEVFILSGDRRAKVDAMADRLRLPREHCLGELSPDEKARRVRQMDARDTLYLGDGANDSLAFDAAWISGTPAIDRGLLEQKAGFYFLGRGLSGVRVLLATAALRRRTARAVVAFALTYNAVAVVLCLAGRMSPLLAAIFMPASSLVSLAIVFAGFRGRHSC